MRVCIVPASPGFHLGGYVTDDASKWRNVLLYSLIRTSWARRKSGPCSSACIPTLVGRRYVFLEERRSLITISGW